MPFSLILLNRYFYYKKSKKEAWGVRKPKAFINKNKILSKVFKSRKIAKK